MTSLSRPTPFAPTALAAYARRVWREAFVPYRMWWLSGVAALMAFNHFFAIGLGFDKSLDDRVALLAKWPATPKRGDYVQFRYEGHEGPIPAGLLFYKIVVGVPGDVVTWRGQDVYINGQYQATAKTHSKMGMPLPRGPEGVIPPGHYFVFGTHKDSLDSRYALAGWISQSQITAHTLWRP